MQCPFCNNTIKEAASFCSRCGKKIPRCPTCGTVIRKSLKFCINDGTPIPEEIQFLFPRDLIGNEQTDVHRAEHLERKFCINCGNPCTHGSKFCIECLKKEKETSSGTSFCIECGHPCDEGKMLCSACNNKKRKQTNNLRSMALITLLFGCILGFGGYYLLQSEILSHPKEETLQVVSPTPSEELEMHETLDVFDGSDASNTNLPKVPPVITTEHQHDWGEWLIEVRPTCETEGIETRKCKSDSSHEESRVIASIGHDWLPATFTKPQYCLNCGNTIGSPAPESTVPSVEELQYLIQNSGHSTVSNEGVRLALPNESSYLSSPYRTKIRSSARGGRIYIMPIPKSGNGNLGKINDGTEVIIMAKQSGYLFFVAYDGRMGWNGEQFFGER